MKQSRPLIVLINDCTRYWWLYQVLIPWLWCMFGVILSLIVDCVACCWCCFCVVAPPAHLSPVPAFRATHPAHHASKSHAQPSPPAGSTCQSPVHGTQHRAHVCNWWDGPCNNVAKYNCHSVEVDGWRAWLVKRVDFHILFAVFRFVWESYKSTECRFAACDVTMRPWESATTKFSVVRYAVRSFRALCCFWHPTQSSATTVDLKLCVKWLNNADTT